MATSTHTHPTAALVADPADRPFARAQARARRSIRETAHMLLDLPVGIVGFSVLVSLLATGASLAITLVGVPLLAGTLVVARKAADAERARAQALLGIAIAAPATPQRPDTTLRRIVAPLRDRAAWRAAGYFLLMLPVGTVTFTAAVTWWATALFLTTLPAWAWALPQSGLDTGDGSRWSAPWELALSSGAGVLLLAATPFVIHALTRIDRMALRLLAPRP